MIPPLFPRDRQLAAKFPNTFQAWRQMWLKTTDPTHPLYPEEGGRGIKVCPQWKSFSTFLHDAGPSPDDARG